VGGWGIGARRQRENLKKMRKRTSKKKDFPLGQNACRDLGNVHASLENLVSSGFCRYG